MKKIWALYIFFILIFLSMITLLITGKVFGDIFLVAIGRILGISLVFFLLVGGVVISIIMINNKKIFNGYLKSLRYYDAIECFEKKKIYYITETLRSQANYYLLNLYFYANDLTNARRLIENKTWRKYKTEELYFEILLNILDNKLNEAYEKYDFFILKKNKGLEARQKLLTQVINLTKDRKSYHCVETQMPIIEKIIKMYSK